MANDDVTRHRDPPSQGGTDDHARAGRVPADASIRTFLIVDVRGYTRFTQELGDEEAGRLAGAFAELARETIVSGGGELIELRGDEALCVFGSARQALRAAVELQTTFRRQTADGLAFPLPIGVGLDAGEAVPIEGGYRGGALNTAARLCSLAGPGQILATDTVVSLARRLEGIRFVPRRPVRLKGLEKSVRVIEVVPEAGLPPLPVDAVKKRPWARRRLAVAALAAVTLVAALIALALIRLTGRDYLAGLEANSIGVIDAEAKGIESQVELDSVPTAITGGEGFVWIASEDGTVSRFDPDLRTVPTLPLGGRPGGVAYGAGSLWVTNRAERAVIQINPKTTAPVQSIQVGNDPGAVAVGKDAVWVANTIDGTLSRIKLATGSVTDVIPIGGSPAGVAVGAGAVWVSSEDTGTVVRIDPASRTIVGAINVGNGPTGIAIGEGGVWVANRQDGTVSRIDPASNSVSATIRVGTTPFAIAASPEAVWVANSGDGTITRIERTAETYRTKTLTLGSSPNALILADRRLWGTTTQALAGHRGGVLRVESTPSTCGCADPAFSVPEIVNLTDQNVPALAYDGLVAYRRVGGGAGARLVGNLAVNTPTPTDEGRTYGFQLRRGIRYSDGALVRASDFRFALERLFTINRKRASDFYGGIVGAAKKCSARRCDLSEGIEVDDGAGRITIRLTEPDPEFLHKLALPLASLVPAGTPLRAADAQPIPGTGPYRISLFDPDGDIRLTRNPRFSVWSRDARPDGYPDEIRFHLSDNLGASIRAVEKEDADWVSLIGLPGKRLRGLLTRHADRLHADPWPQTTWFFLNTRVPPFNDVRARQAVNYATDRGAVNEFVGGVAAAKVTCQILPPGFPGYRPYCPYTRNPNPAGTWSAPDLAKARALIAASETAGMRVEVLVHDVPTLLRNGRYFVSLLRQLGYRSSLRVFPEFGEYFGYVADSRNRAQIGITGWLANFLAASDFLRSFTCTSYVPKSPANENFSAYCDPRLDARMKQTAGLQASDPVRASELWAEVEHALVDRAVAVPIANPRNRVFVSERVGNYQSHPLWGTLLDQLWVK